MQFVTTERLSNQVCNPKLSELTIVSFKIAIVKGATKKGSNKEQNWDYKTQNVAKRSKMRLFWGVVCYENS